MKFLKRGDSVVSLRFKYALGENGPEANTESIRPELAVRAMPTELAAELQGVQAEAEGGQIAVEVTEARMALIAAVEKGDTREALKIGLAKDAETTERGKKTPSTPLVSVTGSPSEITQKLAEAQEPVSDFLASLTNDVTDNFGPVAASSQMAAMEAMA